MTRRLLCVLLAIFLCAACTSAPSTPGPKGPPLVAELARSSVALVGMRDDGSTRPYCSGTWISSTEFLTAGHCVVEDDGTPTPQVSYQTAEGGRVAYASVLRLDTEADLALLVDIFPPMHSFVNVALWAPPQGAEVHVLGNPRGFWFTYLHGYVAASERQYPTSLGITGPFLQVQVPIAPGNSGGGCFNVAGELVGVASWTRRDVPAQGFFIHTSTIRRFLTKG